MYDSVEHLSAADHPELLAATVAGRAAELPSAVVFSIDPEIADTDALCEAFGEDPETCGNCVIVKGKRGDVEKPGPRHDEG